MKITAFSAVVAIMAIFSTSTVQAHVTTNPSVGQSGAYFQTYFRVPHGCTGNATDSVTIEIPANVTSVKPQARYPWNVTINMIPLNPPVVTSTGTVNETVGSVTWSNGNLLDSMYEDFGLQFKLPVMNGTLYWNAYQHCVNNVWQNWTNRPGADGKVVGEPAPTMTVLTTLPGSAAVTTGGGANSGAEKMLGSTSVAVVALVAVVGLLL